MCIRDSPPPPTPNPRIPTPFSHPCARALLGAARGAAGLNDADGLSLWLNPEETELPQLCRHAARLTSARRRSIVDATCEGVVALCEGIAKTVHTTEALPEKARAKAAFDDAVADAEPRLRAVVSKFGAVFAREVRAQIQPQLLAGADAASRRAHDTAEAWHSMHWATYKATLRRRGVFRINVSTCRLSPRRRRRASNGRRARARTRRGKEGKRAVR